MQPVSLTQMSMRLGLMVGLYQVVKYLLFALGVTYGNNLLNYLFVLLFALFPLLAIILQRRARDTYFPNRFPFFISWSLSFMTIFYSVVVSAVATYLYLEVIDTDRAFFDALNRTIEYMISQKDMIQEIGADESILQPFEAMADIYQNITPLQFTKSFISTTLISGNILSLFVAIFTMKR